MLNLCLNNENLKNILRNYCSFKEMSLIEAAKNDNVTCIHIKNISNKKLKIINQNFQGKTVIYIIDRKIADFVFNYLECTNCSYILVDEIEEQMQPCLNVTNNGGIYISEYFKTILKIKCENKFLTNRELYLIELIKNGYNYQEISSITGLCYGTIKNYVSQILKTFEFEDRTELALYFHQIIEEPDD